MIFDITSDGRRVTTAVFVVGASDGLPEIVALGEAKCRPDDSFSAATGELIAVGRAFQELGRQIEEFGDSRVITKADIARVVDHLFEAAVGV